MYVVILFIAILFIVIEHNSNMSIKMQLSQSEFELIKGGKKTHELHICNDVWRELKVGKVLTFFSEYNKELKLKVVETRDPKMKVGEMITLYEEVKEKMTIFVTEIFKEKSFKDAIQKVGQEKVFPMGIEKTIDSVIDDICYKKYNRSMEEEFGVVVFGMKVIEYEKY